MATHVLEDQIAHLKSEVVAQSREVLAIFEAAVDSLFAGDKSKARGTIAQDDAIDQTDVRIEKEAVRLLTEATAIGASLESDQLRLVLVLVKVNNELERIADGAVALAELVPEGMGRQAYPETFRVMANSVIGILRDSGRTLETENAELARVVLQSQHAVTQFKRRILRDAEEAIAAGKMTVDWAFRLHELAGICEVIADHCTNIAEQVIYLASGAIVRHLPTCWSEIPQRGS